MNTKRWNTIFVVLSLFLGLAAGVSAQVAPYPQNPYKGDSLDVLRYRVVYELDYLQDPTDREFVTKDFVRLDIGSHLSKEYSGLYYQADSAFYEAAVANKPINFTFEVVPPWVLYKNYEKPGSLLVDYRLPMKAPVARYEDALPKISWQLTGEKSELLGYPVEEAKCAFGGRQWTAWFTSEIPISDGPYKFGGLPGLILDLKDSEGDYHYRCVSFTEAAAPEAILLWSWRRVEKLSLDQLKNIVRQLHGNVEVALRALGDNNTQFAGAAMVDMPYNPIEKDWK